jgi:hypothetical protein
VLEGPWNGEAAAALYRGPLIETLRRLYGNKRRRFTILEDNDPTGYKSNKGKVAKEELKIDPIKFPKYSPDLNLLDFYVWSEIERRALLSKAASVDTAAKYKARLRRIAKALPRDTVLKATAGIAARAKEVVQAKGGHISKD